MPKYEVIMKEIEIYQLEIEAENEEDAKKHALAIAEDPKEFQKYHHDSDGDIEVYKI